MVSVKDAIVIGREVAEFRLSWIEDPIPANDHDGLRQITEALETPGLRRRDLPPSNRIP